jgi:flagellar biogenesis protein FliO
MEWVRQILAVSGVLLMLAASLWWLRRRGLARYGMRPARGARKRTLEAVERLALGPQHSLHLVRLSGRGLLVGVSPAGCAVLESFDWAAVERTGRPEAA